MCKNHSLSKLFQAWKKYHYTRKRDKINKIAARAFRERRATKKFFNSWRLYAGEKVSLFTVVNLLIFSKGIL